MVPSPTGSNLASGKRNQCASQSPSQWVTPHGASPLEPVVLLQNQMKPNTPKLHRSCRGTDSELWACCLLPSPSPSIFPFGLTSQRDREKQIQRPPGPLQMCSRATEMSSPVSGSMLLLNCNEEITQNAFSSLSTSNPEQSIWGVAVSCKQEESLGL